MSVNWRASVLRSVLRVGILALVLWLVSSPFTQETAFAQEDEDLSEEDEDLSEEDEDLSEEDEDDLSDDAGDADDDDDDDDDDGDDVVDDVGEGPFPGEGRFFFDRPEGAAGRRVTKFRGSLTSSSYLFRELGVELPEGPNGGEGTAQRLFTDMRLRMDVEHLGGGNLGFRVDVRGRYLPGSCKIDSLDNRDNPNTCTRLQSGTFGGNELDLREIFATRKAGNLELVIGRQFVLELAAHRLDGAMIRLKSSKAVSYLGFVGLHPQKGSRDIRQDYPNSAKQTDGTSKRIMPVTAGGGVAYRFEKFYGSLGGVFVMPLAEAPTVAGTDGQQETPRVFVSDTGYYRVSPRLDLHHYAVVDVLGSAAFALTNLTLGANGKLSPNLRLTGQFTRVDTETLTATAQTKVSNPDIGGGAIQNSIEVLRIAADALRLGVSGSFSRRRYELSTNFAFRRRPEITLTQPGGGAADTVVVLPSAKDLEAVIRFVDRQSIGGFRLAGQVSRNFGVGANQYQRSSNLVVRADAQRSILSGKGEIDAHASFIQSSAVVAGGPGTSCGAGVPEQFDACFAGSSATTFNLGATLFYRVGAKLMAIASGNVGTQSIDSSAAMGTPAAGQGRITPVSLFLRLAYRL